VRSISDKNIHVLHVVPTLGPGGIQLTLSRVVRELSGRGMRHSIVCLKGEAIIRDHFDETAQIYCMHSGVNDLRLPWHLWRLIRNLKPTVIHARNWSAWPDVALARLFTFPVIPLLFSFHGQDTAGPIPLRRRIAFRILARITTHIFAVSNVIKEMLVQNTGLPAGQISVIPNGVDTDRFRPASIKCPDTRQLVVGSVGSLTPVKNHALLIRACAELITNGIDLELRIAGEGPERSKLVELAKVLIINDRVHLMGHLDDIPRFLQGLDIFVLPSSSEAHPNALLEAMACGLPCIATEVGGVSEVMVGDGPVGRVIKPEDLTDLVHAIAELADSQTERDILGNAARNRVCQKYSSLHMINSYAALYGQSLANYLCA